MFMFDFVLATLSLAPIGLFLLFWRLFPRDRGVHPIYREAGIEMIDNRTEVQDMTARRAMTSVIFKTRSETTS